MSTSQPLIVETVMAPDVETLRAQRDAATFADLVELRLDGLTRPDAAAALAGRRCPVIVTCRAAWEGGHFQGSEADRRRILAEALALGAEYVDIEWRAPDCAALATGPDRHRVVLSMHDFVSTPSDLGQRVGEMRRLGTGIVKAAVRTTRLADLRPLLEIGRDASAAGARTVLIGMGPAGVPSRTLPAHFGSCWTYGGPAVAPGQVVVRRLVEEFRVREVSAGTPVYAVVGAPIGHSVSPAMHNAAFAALAIPGVYVPCDAAGFDDFLALADLLPIAGASVTAPFKQAAWQAQRGSGGQTTSAGVPAGRDALNTLRRAPGGEWEGLNTDIDGFLAPLGDEPLDRRRAAVLGAGGSARSVVAGLIARGASVSVHARRLDAATVLALDMGVEAAPWPPAAGEWDVLVNTTPVGTFPAVDVSPMAGQPLTGALVYDLVYNPRPTRLLRDAQRAGLRTIDGLEMLVEQARRQFAWWTGAMPPAETMRGAAEQRLAEMMIERAHAAATAEEPSRP